MTVPATAAALPSTALRAPRHSAHRPSRIAMALAGLAAVMVMAAGPAVAQSAPQKKGDAACAAYGPDFQKAPGSDSCVRMRSGVQADAVGGRSVTNAPNQGFGPGQLGTADSTGSTSAPDPWKTAR